MSTLEASLIDVRRAYRLIWGYQRRIMDLTQLIADGFSGHEFYAWTPFSYGRPSQLTTNSLNKWAWDALPFYKVSFLYLPTGREPNQLKVADWMLEMRVDSDDVDFTGIRGEPDAEKFPDATATASTIRLVAWKCTEDMEGNWYWDIWSKSDWPSSDIELSINPEYPVTSMSLTVPLQDLPGRDEVLALVEKFKLRLRNELQIAID